MNKILIKIINLKLVNLFRLGPRRLYPFDSEINFLAQGDDHLLTSFLESIPMKTVTPSEVERYNPGEVKHR